MPEIESKVEWVIEAFDVATLTWIEYVVGIESGEEANQIYENVQRDVPERKLRVVRSYKSRFVESD